jgi:hypothetical protein
MGPHAARLYRRRYGCVGGGGGGTDCFGALQPETVIFKGYSVFDLALYAYRTAGPHLAVAGALIVVFRLPLASVMALPTSPVTLLFFKLGWARSKKYTFLGERWLPTSFAGFTMPSVLLLSFKVGLAAAETGDAVTTRPAASKHETTEVVIVRFKWHSCRGTGPFAVVMERARGIEPRPTAWKAVILPLNHARSSR